MHTYIRKFYTWFSFVKVYARYFVHVICRVAHVCLNDSICLYACALLAGTFFWHKSMYLSHTHTQADWRLNSYVYRYTCMPIWRHVSTHVAKCVAQDTSLEVPDTWTRTALQVHTAGHSKYQGCAAKIQADRAAKITKRELNDWGLDWGSQRFVPV